MAIVYINGIYNEVTDADYFFKSLKPGESIHRIDGPAFIRTSVEEWFIRGIIHREDGPARIWENGGKEWYLHGQRHRLNGPAITWENGTKEWYVYGKRHRLNGPAIIDQNGYKGYWINGNKFTYKQYQKVIPWL